MCISDVDSNSVASQDGFQSWTSEALHGPGFFFNPITIVQWTSGKKERIIMYVCVYACCDACMHVCTYVCLFVCMHSCMHVHMLVCSWISQLLVFN